MRAFCLPLGLFLLILQPGFSLERTDYRAVRQGLPDGRIAWRAWTEAGVPRLLAVDPQTLRTSLVSGKPGLDPVPPVSTALSRLEAAARERRHPLQNAGVRKAQPPRTGAWLTFDLCPSALPLDQTVFLQLEADAQPLPVMLEVSGRWMETHPAGWAWLVGERNAGRLEITWVNHTEHHRYRPKVPLKENFLLLPDTDLKDEIFTVEQRLLDAGELPSVFFRFPGLVSSPDLVDQVLSLGLVPLGSSSWLAKNEPVRSGALVLTHPNGNEPEGEKDLEGWDFGHQADLASGEWNWLGLDDWAAAWATD